jgi:flagellar biosynthesis protein FliR
MRSLQRLLNGMDAVEEKAEGIAQDKFSGESFVGRAAQTGTVLTVVTLGITILIGILVYSEVQNSLPSPSNNQLDNASTNATDTFAQAMELAPVIMIILLAAVVLAVVQRFR